jgi:hypothetical protein
MILSGGQPTPISLIAVWMSPWSDSRTAQVLLIVGYWHKTANGRLNSSDRNDGHVWTGRLLWQVNLQPAFGLSKFQ